MTIYRARMHPWGKALNFHTYIYQCTLLTLSLACVGQICLNSSILECRNFGALVLKPQRNKPHKDPVLGRTCCYGENHANMSRASCLFFSCQQENTKSNPNVSELPLTAILALLCGFNSVFNQGQLLLATVPWGIQGKSLAFLFMHLLLRHYLSMHLCLA